MWTTHYQLTVTPKNEQPHNWVHDEIDKKDVVILEAKVGAPAWLCCKVDDAALSWHRITTSIVKSIDVHDDNYMTIETENSYYDFHKMEVEDVRSQI